MGNNNTSGLLAEALVLERLGLEEPQVEIKALASHNSYLKIKLAQLEKNVGSGKDYLIVLYDRQRKRNWRKKQVRYGRSIEEAMKTALIFRFSAHALMLKIHNAKGRVRWVPDRAGDGPWGSFYAELPIASLFDDGVPEPETR